MDTNNLPNSHTNKDHKSTLSQASLFKWDLPESSRLHNNIFITQENNKKSFVQQNTKGTQHCTLTAMTTLDISLYLVYNPHDISSKNNMCHYNCSFSFTYLHVWYSQSMTLYHHLPIFMAGLFPTTSHSVHILIHKYQTANTYHVIFISSVIYVLLITHL